MNASLLDDFHSSKVFLFTALIGKTAIPPGYFYVVMTHEHLQTFQAHTGIEQFACKGVPKTVDCVAFVLKPRFPQISYKDIPGRSVTQAIP
jgi:hypothetical protein